MKFNKDKLGKSWVPYTVAACTAVMVYLIFGHLGSIWQVIGNIFRFIAPVFSGAVIAYVIDALVMFYQRSVFRKVPHPKTARRLSILLALVSIVLLVVLLFVALVPQLVESITVLIGNLSSYAASLRGLLDNVELEIGGYNVDLSGILVYGDTLLQNLITAIQDNIGSILNTSYNIGKGFVNGGINCILAIYFLLDKEKVLALIKRLMRLWLPEERYDRTVSFLRRCNHILIRFLACDLIDGLIVGVVNFLFMTFCGMPYAVLISVVVGVANLVPTFGPIVGGVLGAFILLLASPYYVLWFLIFTIVLQTVDGYILKPKLYGDTLGVSSLLVLIAIIVGGRMFGAAGVVLAVPLAAILDFVYRDILWARLERREKPPSPPPESPPSAE